MQNYNHVVGLKIVGEMLPQEANRVTLAGDVDQYGLRIPRITYSWCDNDRRLINHSLNFMTQALQAVDARDIWTQDDDTCHLHGTARMGSAPSNSVVNADCRSWDIPNLWICDGSVFSTVGGANPSLTIQAIACRSPARPAKARCGLAFPSPTSPRGCSAPSAPDRDGIGFDVAQKRQQRLGLRGEIENPCCTV
jgi:choline dehydrogenase-like flavoprotein